MDGGGTDHQAPLLSESTKVKLYHRRWKASFLGQRQFTCVHAIRLNAQNLHVKSIMLEHALATTT